MAVREAKQPAPAAGDGYFSAQRESLTGLLVETDRPTRYLEVHQAVITPEIAARLLEIEGNIREPNTVTVNRYAEDMANGKWSYTGEPLIYDEDGLERNGRHRLEACVKSGAAFETLVVVGVDPDSMLDMDTGRHRNFSLYLAYQGYGSPRNLAAAITSAFQLIEMGYVVHNKISNEVLLDWLNFGHEEIIEDLSVVQPLEKMVPAGYTAKHMAAIRHLARMTPGIDLVQIDKFFLELAEATETISTKSPAYWLRRFLAREVSAGGKDRIQDEDRFATTIKAINLYIHGEKIGNAKRIVWNKDKKEPFPVLTPADS